MARRLKYPAPCYKCGTVTKNGFLTRIKGKWMGHCQSCYDTKKPQ